MVDISLLEDFITETQEHIEEMEAAMLQLAKSPADRPLINTIFRQLHTIKGSAEYLGLQHIGELTHHLEAVLETVRQGKMPVDQRMIDLLLQSGDRIGHIVRELADSGNEQSEVGDLLAAVEKITRSEPIPAGAPPRPEKNQEIILSEEETDPELFDIFMGQMNEGFGEMKRLAVALRTDDDPSASLGRLETTLRNLKSSANYMGYDGLCEIYDRLSAAIREADLQIMEDTFDEREFIVSQLCPTLETISNMMPGARLDPKIKWPGEWRPSRTESTPVDGIRSDTTLFEDLPDALLREEGFSPDGGTQIPISFEIAADTPSVRALDKSLIAEFVEEASEHLREMEAGLLGMTDAAKRAEAIQMVFRAVHTIKGSSEYIGLSPIASLCHALEDLLERIRQGKRAVDPAVVDLLLESRDCLDAQVAALTATNRPMAKRQDLIDRIRSALSPKAIAAETKPPAAPQPRRPDHYPQFEGLFEEAYDADLFGIFKGHLRDELEEIRRRCDALDQGERPVKVVESCREHLKRLRFSANYMGYESLCGFYDDWLERLAAVFPKDAISEDEDPIGVLKEIFHPRISHLEKSIRLHDEESRNACPPDILENGVDPADAMWDDVPEIDVLEKFACQDQTMGADIRAMFHPAPTPSETSEALARRLQDALDIHARQLDPHPDLMKSAVLPSPEEAPGAHAIPLQKTPLPDPAPPMTEDRPSTSDQRSIKHTIRVDAAKIDTLMNQVGELVVNRSLFSQLNTRMRALQQTLKHIEGISKQDFKQIRELGFKFTEATVALGRVANDLQEGIMKVRMLPVSQLFNRYPRLVHDLTRNSDKQVSLVIEGEETELDRMVIEEIADPLVHIIRNAVDHGIETTAERRMAGKPETGTIRLNAFHESNHVVIEISDDGRGIDMEKVQRKALEMGILKPERMAGLSRAETLELITAPGFSTADRVTHTSGRGVGMDVVKRNIEKINGTLEVESPPGHGTRIRIKIPLTLAIFPALLVKVERDIFTIPLSSVEETLRVFSHELTRIEGVEVLHLRDTPLPLIRLTRAFHIKVQNPEREKLFVVVVRVGEKRVGVVVDELIGQEEVVIKPLEDYLQENSGFSGATILGDGHISLILDVYELVKISMDQQIRMQVDAELG